MEPVKPVAAVHLAPDRARPAPAAQTCERCQGVCETGMRFCKFCGAPLPQADRAPAAEGLGRSPEYSKASTRQGIQAAVAEAAARQVSPKPREAAPQPVPAEEPTRDRNRLELAAQPAPQEPPAAAPAQQQPAAPTGMYVPYPGRGPQAAGRLVIIAGDGQEGPSYPLSGDQVDIGRNEGTVVLPEDRYMSPRHARLIRKDGRWYVRDLGSTNGVFVRLKAPHQLAEGDLLLLGVEVLRFEPIMDAEVGLGPAIQHGTLVFGSPALPRPARLVQRTVEGVARDVYHLHRLETVIGRESGDIVFTDDPYMSRRHAAIRRDNASGKFTLVDLDSSNGTFVAARGDWPVQDGDSIRVGQHLFRIELIQA